MIKRLFLLLALLLIALPASAAGLRLGVLPAADSLVLHVAHDEGLF